MGRPSRESRLLAVLFFAPPVLVALAVLGPWELDWLPQAETPYGSRFEPPVALPDTPLQTLGAARAGWSRGRWSLIYAREAGCDAPCLRSLAVVRQAALALPRDTELVQGVFLYGGELDALSAQRTATAGLVVGRIDRETSAALRRALGEGGLRDGYLLIADPGGRLVFGYPPDAQLEGIVSDLRRLLALYRIV